MEWGDAGGFSYHHLFFLKYSRIAFSISSLVFFDVPCFFATKVTKSTHKSLSTSMVVFFFGTDSP